jgi:hypothetical protein
MLPRMPVEPGELVEISRRMISPKPSVTMAR